MKLLNVMALLFRFQGNKPVVLHWERFHAHREFFAGEELVNFRS